MVGRPSQKLGTGCEARLEVRDGLGGTLGDPGWIEGLPRGLESIPEVWVTIPEVRVVSGGRSEDPDGPNGGSGDPPGYQGRVKRPSRISGMGWEAIPEVSDRLGGKSGGVTGGPERFGRPSRRSGTGQESLSEVQIVSAVSIGGP